MTSPIRFLLDPGLWVREVLGHTPWEKQVQILESIRDHKVTAVKSAHACGKSFSAAECALWFLFNHPHSIVISTAPTDRQVSGILWREIRSAHSKAGLPGACLQTELKIDNDHFALGFTAPPYAGDKFQGFHAPYILVIVDESAGVSDDIFDAIDGILTSDESRLLLIGNPTSSSGRFYKEFSTASGANKISISAFDTPNFTRYGITEQDLLAGTWQEKIAGSLPAPFLVTPGWVADRIKQWGKESPLYQSKVLANFPTAGDNSLIPLAWIEAAVERDLPVGEPVQLGCDIARFGSDMTVLMLREGSRARILKVLPMSDTMATAGEIIRGMRECGASVAKVDGAGVGGGVVDRLEEQALSVVDVQSAASAEDKERFGNLRAEMWWTLRERFESGDISIPDDEELIAQLAGIRYKVNSKGQVFIESKEDMKRRGVSSPDRADALMLVFGNSDHIRDALFPRGLVESCVSRQERKRVPRTEYYAAIAGTPTHDMISFALGHVSGGKIIVDEFKQWQADREGKLPWPTIFHEAYGLCLHYRIELLIHTEHSQADIREHFEDCYLSMMPQTPTYRSEVYEELETRIKNDQIRYPDTPQLIQELRGLERKRTGDRFAVRHPERGRSDSGALAVAMLTRKLGDWFDASYFQDDPPRGSSEWPDDDDRPDRVNSACGLMGGKIHEYEEGRP
ncbi:MAG: hypothetical protein WCE46_03970 [Methanoregula sp.]|uniref:hypothetical protein n=1 Tax=Methanoregula sp. TaxID=2052170 RepID=UPI003C73B4A9